MKKLFAILLVVLMLCAMAACSQPSSKPEVTQTPEPEKTVVFSDPLLEKMVRAAMNKPEGDITLTEAEAVTELALGIDWQPQPAPNSQITDITGLEHFINLEDLNLAFHAITDISPLAGLTKLRLLSLGGNPVADISPLSNLTNLEFLPLFNCQAQDYSPLAGLTKLGGLLLDHSTISDVSMLSGLTELWWLGLANTQVSDVSPLAGLTNLRQLQLANCPITDYAPLAVIYPKLEDKDFSIVESLRELGFEALDDAGQTEGYKTEEMFVLINRAEWGEPDNTEAANGVLLCKNYRTDREITVVYYPDEEKFLVTSPQVVFRYTWNPKSEEMNVEYGEEKANAFIEEAYGEVDPYLLLTPIKDFYRVMTDTFGVTANTLFTLPRETEAAQLPEQPAASENTLIGLGFGFDDAGTSGVYEQHEPHYMNVAIHRPEWGEFNEDWNMQYLDQVNGYGVIMWFYAEDDKYDIQIERNGKSAKFEYFPSTGEHSEGYPDPELVAQLFNDAFGTQGDGFADKPLANFEQFVQERFGMSVDELYGLPVGK